MKRIGSKGRYGIVVMQYQEGTWWWCEALNVIDLVPPGRQLATVTLSLTDRNNTLDGALRRIARFILLEPKPCPST